MTDLPTRRELQELRARKAMLTDAARPEAVARRHAAGRRTARENVDDLVDPGSFREYGGLAVAAQRHRRNPEELIATTPADGIIAGLARIGTDRVGAERARCAVLSYDYLVLAGTQGMTGHRKTDRVLDVVDRMKVPVVFFTEGGGGRPGDSGHPTSAALDVLTFTRWARLSGKVPRIAIASGRCFAGNAALFGMCDIAIATSGANIGMGGPAMIAPAGVGAVASEDIGPAAMHSVTGVVDVPVDGDAEAVAAARLAVSFFQGPHSPGSCADQAPLREVVPQNRRRAYDVRPVVRLLADEGSLLELRPRFARNVVTALARVDGRPVGIVANNPLHLAGAITSDSADKAARFLQLCDAFGLPVVSLCDTPGIMVGVAAEETGLVRHAARLFTVGANLTVPMVTVILRKCYGLGAMAMAGGDLGAPLATLAWPTAELGPMGLEGAVQLALRRELAAIDDPEERDRTYQAAVAAAYEQGKVLSAATTFDVDDVIDPAETRTWITAVFGSAAVRGSGRYVDTW